MPSGYLATLEDTKPDHFDGGSQGPFTMPDGTTVTLSEIGDIICFTTGTRILTTQGERAIETLNVGDTVITRDNGLQPIRWIGSRTVPAISRFAPVRFNVESLPNLTRPLLVSPQHHVLISGHRAAQHLGTREVLVSAKHLINGTSITRATGGYVTYTHMLFNRHEIVYADGTASESFHPNDTGLNAITDKARDEVFKIFPQLRSGPSEYGATARKCLSKHEALFVA